MRFCASKTPGRRKGTDTEASNRDCRGLVVWGTRVTSARSWSSAGTLIATAGRTFAAIPRSTSQTSPRRGTAIKIARADRARRRGDPRRRRDRRRPERRVEQARLAARARRRVQNARARKAPRTLRAAPGLAESWTQRPTMPGAGQVSLGGRDAEVSTPPNMDRSQAPSTVSSNAAALRKRPRQPQE